MAWIKTRKKSGKRQYLFAWRQAGRERTKLMPVNTRRQAERLFRSWESQLDEKLSIERPVVLLRDAASALVCRPGISASHSRNLEGKMARIQAFFGATTPIEEIDRPAILNWIDSLRRLPGRRKDDPTVANTTVRHYIHALSALFEYARERNWIDANPCREIRVSKVLPGDAAPRDRVITPDEYQAIIDHAVEHVRWFTALAWETGGRMSEILQLRWEDITDSTITFRHAPGKGQRTKSGKTRTVPANPETVAYLREQAGEDQSGWVFLNRQTNKRILSVKRGLAAAARRAGVPGHITAHNFRHSYSSHLISAGTPIHVVRDLLGHSDVRVTSGYTHSQAEEHAGYVANLFAMRYVKQNTGPNTGPMEDSPAGEVAVDEVVSLMNRLVSIMERETGFEPATLSLEVRRQGKFISLTIYHNHTEIKQLRIPSIDCESLRDVM